MNCWPFTATNPRLRTAVERGHRKLIFDLWTGHVWMAHRPPGGRTLIARKPIRVMIVDDSAIVRQVASEAIAAQTDMRVLATASDPPLRPSTRCARNGRT
jgi:hypothetical protein